MFTTSPQTWPGEGAGAGKLAGWFVGEPLLSFPYKQAVLLAFVCTAGYFPAICVLSVSHLYPTKNIDATMIFVANFSYIYYFSSGLKQFM